MFLKNVLENLYKKKIIYIYIYTVYIYDEGVYLTALIRETATIRQSIANNIIKIKTMDRCKTIDLKMLIVYRNNIFYIYCKIYVYTDI